MSENLQELQELVERAGPYIDTLQKMVEDKVSKLNIDWEYLHEIDKDELDKIYDNAHKLERKLCNLWLTMQQAERELAKVQSHREYLVRTGQVLNIVKPEEKKASITELENKLATMDEAQTQALLAALMKRVKP